MSVEIAQFQFPRGKLNSSIHIIFHFNSVFRLTTVVLTMHRQKKLYKKHHCSGTFVAEEQAFFLGTEEPLRLWAATEAAPEL
jgi:hypothetical protein